MGRPAHVDSAGVPVPSLFERLEPLLPRVSKPIQYVGGELNARVKDWDEVAVHWALMYPDAYEVGLPNKGVQILYEVINERPDALAERTYSVWPDLEALMREAKMLMEQGIPVLERLRVSPSCPLILPSHVALDRARRLGPVARQGVRSWCQCIVLKDNLVVNI